MVIWSTLCVKVVNSPRDNTRAPDLNLPNNFPTNLHEKESNVSTNQTVAQNEVPEVDNFIFICYVSVFSFIKIL